MKLSRRKLRKILIETLLKEGKSKDNISKLQDALGQIKTSQQTIAVATASKKDPYVKAAQEALKALGHYDGDVDGNMYAKGYKKNTDPFSLAVKSFQSKNNLKNDGKLGKKSLKALIEKYNEKNISPKPASKFSSQSEDKEKNLKELEKIVKNNSLIFPIYKRKDGQSDNDIFEDKDFLYNTLFGEDGVGYDRVNASIAPGADPETLIMAFTTPGKDNEIFPGEYVILTIGTEAGRELLSHKLTDKDSGEKIFSYNPRITSIIRNMERVSPEERDRRKKESDHKVDEITIRKINEAIKKIDIELLSL